MEEKDVEALGRGLAAGLAEALAGALDQTVGTSGIAERRSAAEKQERADTLRAMRDEALAAYRERLEGERECCASMAERAVNSYCADVRKRIFEEAEDDPRLPETINYLQRYEALRKAESRNAIVDRLEQTLDLADKIIADAARVDPGAYFAEAAADYRDRVLELEGVVVAEPKRDEAEERAKQQELRIAEALRFADDAASVSYEDAMAALGERLEKAFSDEVFSLDAPNASSLASDGFEAERRALSEKIDAAEQLMERRYGELCAANAAMVAASRMSLGDLPRFAGKVACERKHDPREVAAFAAEVRRSFVTYRRVIGDNGVFAAFSDGSDFGRCNGALIFSGTWLSCLLAELGYDEGGESDSRASRGIPSAIEEDDVEGGDSPARATEKLRQLNKKRYFGLLDDDFSVHVDAFWYGFRKLMEFVNGLYEVNLREFVDYCDALQDSAAKRARALGVLMSEDQAQDFANQVKGLAGGLPR